MSAGACAKIILDNSAVIQGSLTTAICENGKVMLEAIENPDNMFTEEECLAMARHARLLDNLNQSLTASMSDAARRLAQLLPSDDQDGRPDREDAG